MKRNLRKDEGEFNFWQPATDMMTGLVFILMLIVALLCLYILGDYTGYQEESSSSVASHIDDYEGWGWGWGWDWNDYTGYGNGNGNGYGTGRYDEQPIITAGGGGTGEEGIKSAVYVELVDAETDRAIPEEGVTFELYRTDQTVLQNGSRQTLYTYYPEKISYDDFATTEDGTFYLPEKVWHGNYYFHEITEPEGYDSASDTYFDIHELYDWPDPYVVQIRVSPSKNIIRLQMTDKDTNLPVGGGTFRVIAAEDVKTLDGTVRYTKGQIVGTITCNSEGYGESEELYLGKYTVQQLGVPEYYAALTKDLDVKVEKKTASKPQPDINELFTERSTITVSVTDELYPSQRVSGATFLVTNDRTGETQTVKTDSKGQIVLEQLDKNTAYRIQQQDTSGDYRLDSTEYTVNVSSTGRFDGKADTTLELTNRMLRVAVREVDAVLRSDTESAKLSLYNSDEELLKTWMTNGTSQTFTDLDVGTYYIVRGDNDTSKRYEFTVTDSAPIQEWTISVFTFKSAIVIVIGVLVLGGIIYLLSLLIKLLARIHETKKANKAAKQAAEAAAGGSAAETSAETEEEPKH